SKAVASNLAKLMAYKDEYEVARLYADPTFIARLRDSFEGEPGRDYRIKFHMAPPRFAKRDAEGRPQKRSYGPWMLTAMKTLAPLRALRGTPFDPFGRTDERRRERALIEQYFEMLQEFRQTLDSERLSAAIALAQLPESIRGYGYIKERSMDAAESRRATLLEQYRNPQSATAKDDLVTREIIRPAVA